MNCEIMMKGGRADVPHTVSVAAKKYGGGRWWVWGGRGRGYCL